MWLNDEADMEPAIEILKNLNGVEGVMTRSEAAERFNINPDHIGDLIVNGDRDTMFGEMDVLHEYLPETYRAHGSLHEMRLPLVAWNFKGDIPAEEHFKTNFDLTRLLLVEDH